MTPHQDPPIESTRKIRVKELSIGDVFEIFGIWYRVYKIEGGKIFYANYKSGTQSYTQTFGEKSNQMVLLISGEDKVF